MFKTLNQVGFEIVARATSLATRPVMAVAGDDDLRKPRVMAFCEDLGFRAVDAGGLRAARLLEPFGLLWISLASTPQIGRDSAFALIAETDGTTRP